jgi:hypothetical protein
LIAPPQHAVHIQDRALDGVEVHDDLLSQGAEIITAAVQYFCPLARFDL